MFHGGDEMSGSASGPFGHDGDDVLADMLAAEEADIRDSGFSARVEGEIARVSTARRLTLYSAGMLGFGVAAGSISSAVSNSPAFVRWLDSFAAFMTPHLPTDAGISPLPLAIALVVGGVMAVSVALAAQGR